MESSGKPATREVKELRRDLSVARAEASALEALLMSADQGDVNALAKVNGTYEGRENVRDIILGMRSRALGKEEALLRHQGGRNSEVRLKEIATELSGLHAEMKLQIARHEKAIRSNLDDAYGDQPDELEPDSTMPPQAEKKSFWKRITGG
jgi:hypothetical protein